MTDTVVTLRLAADGSVLSAAAQRAGKDVARVGDQAQQAGTKTAAGMRQGASGADALSKSIASAKSQLGAFLGVTAAIQGARQLAGIADEYTNIGARIRLAAGGSVTFAAGQAQVLAVAQDTASTLSSTAALATKLSTAFRSLGADSDLAFRSSVGLTRTIQQAVQLSGAGAAAADAAIVQLGQGLASGTLRGDELNSILEQTPRLAQAIAEGMGITVGQLRAMGAEGKITAQTIVAALKSQADALNAEFLQLPQTIGRAWTRLSNVVMSYIGRADQSTGASARVAASINWITQNIDAVIGSVIRLGEIVVAVYVGKMIRSGLLWIANLAAQSGAVTAHGVAVTGMGAKTAAAFAASRKEIGLLGIAGNVVFAAFAGWQIGGQIREQFLEARLAGIAFVDGSLVMWERLKQGGAIAWEGIAAVGIGALNTLRTGLANLVDSASSAMQGILARYADAARVLPDMMGGEALASKLEGVSARMGGAAADLSAQLRPATSASDGFKTAVAGINAQTDTAIAKIHAITSDMADYEIAQAAATKAAQAEGAAQGDLTQDLDALLKQLNKTTAAKSGDAAAGADYVKSLVDQVAAYGLVGAALERYRAQQQGLSPAQLQVALAAIAQKEALDALAIESDEAATALETMRAMQSSLGDEIADMRAELGGASAAQIQFNKTQRDAAKAYAIAAKSMDPSALDAYVKAMAAAQEKMDLQGELTKGAEIESIFAQLNDESEFLKLIDKIKTVKDELALAKDGIGEFANTEGIEKLEGAVSRLQEQGLAEIAGSFKALLGSVKTFTKEGSSSFDAIEKGMAALSIVQDILALKAAVVAVLTQAQGEPYSAWARMIAMAAAVAPLLASIGVTLSGVSGGGGGGPSAESAEVRQETQGTGTVLGDPEAKSESIANAVEITADATQELVGLNRGMLNALRSLQASLGSAGGMLARGAGDAEFSREAGDAGNWNWLSGGDSKLIDQGIIIAGGRLNDMLNSIVVGAYQTIETSGGWFQSDDTSDDVTDVSDEFGRQFQLVIGSIIDTVREGALAIGLLPADIEAAIAAYQVEEIRISLEGLSAEDQQAELEAVFSSIFDGLAGNIVPFIEQFQLVGEGLGETLVRVATGVQVTQEAIRQLGITVDETDPERFAQLSEGLITATGGIDALIGGMNSFVANFAPVSQQFKAAGDALTSAFEQAGLAVPKTQAGMWELMQTLDATTEEGREQIATLLRLSDVADQYYNLLDKQVAGAAEYLESIGLAGGALSKFGRELVAIKDSENKAIESANLLAVAHGREGASAVQVAKIHDWASKQIAAAMRRLAQETKDLVSQLYGGPAGTLEGLNEQIAELESATAGVSQGIGAIADAGDDLFERWQSGVKSLSDYLDSSLFGDLSPLNPAEQLSEAQSQLDAAMAAAAGGDADALASLPGLMDQYANLLRDSDASGGDFNSQILDYREQLQGLLGMAGPDAPGAEGGPSPIAVAVSASPELAAMYAARDALLAEQETAHRAVLAQQLAQNLHDMAVLTRTPILEMIALQGVALNELAADMGVNLDNLTGESVLALGNMATTLGISLSTLTGELGINLTDLAGGLTELTGRLGIDLQNMTAASTATLAELANSLGGDLGDLATSLGLDLGDLTDKQSLLNQALAETINTLPDGTRDSLTTLLSAITDATTEADANAAIKLLEDEVNRLGGDTATALAPYLAGVVPAEALTNLDYLADLQDIGEDQLVVLKAIARGLDVPGYAVGSANIRGDQLAKIHDGEMVIDPASADALRKYGIRVAASGGGDAGANEALIAEVRALREELRQLRAGNDAGHRVTSESVRSEGGRAYAQRDDIARRQVDGRRANY